MRISDWSSDVCSSDLPETLRNEPQTTRMSNMLSFRKIAAGAAALSLAIALPFGASAHRAWMLPSSTVVSGDDVWVTVDAAISNVLFYFEHNAMPLARIKAYAPDGSDVAKENGAKGRYRSNFDVHQIGRAHVCTPVTNANLV